MKDKTLKVGMLGAGYILKSHATAVAAIDGATLHAVADVSPTRARNAAHTYGFAEVYESLEDLAASDCDVVHILVPPFLHLEAAGLLVDAGKSVFLEKPMGLDSGACAALCDRAREKGVTVGVNHNFLFGRSYEALRAEIRAGALGRLDELIVNWHYGLQQLQLGPFDTWMLSAPANLAFEIGSHLMAFALDLLGPLNIRSVVVGKPLDLPSGQRCFRHWSLIGESGGATILLSVSLVPGHDSRCLRVRASGGGAQIDFGRDIGWRESSASDNPMLDAHASASSIARQIGTNARFDRFRRTVAAVRKRPGSAPFEESVFRSVSAFYANGIETVDPRHDGRFGSQVIAKCEELADHAGAGRPSTAVICAATPIPLAKPEILVVGGTGFIGRRLVRKLADEGLGVRVLTRNLNNAAIELRGLPVELMQGWHGDAATARTALAGIDTVYHLAKCDGRRWEDYLDGDVEPTRVLAEAAAEAGVRRFIYTGTIDSYASADTSARIDSNTLVDAKIASRNLYARSKAACETLLQTLHRTRGLPLVIARPGIVIGPGAPPAHLGICRFFSESHADYWGDGSNMLPLVLVDDVADALVQAGKVKGIEGEAFLLTSPPLLSAADYVNAMGERAGVRIDARPRPAWRHWLADMAKELVKNTIRHPNRRWSTLRDWKCRSHCAHYDSSDAQMRLGWSPVSHRGEMISRGIHAAVDYWGR